MADDLPPFENVVELLKEVSTATLTTVLEARNMAEVGGGAQLPGPDEGRDPRSLRGRARALRRLAGGRGAAS